MLKKLTLLALSVAALVAFAVPAAASAADWTHEGVPIESNQEVEFSGPANFSTATAGAHATVHADIVLKPGGTGTVTSFVATGCTGTGALNNIPCASTARNLPWTVHANANGTIRITNIDIHNNYSGFATTVLTGNLIATPDNSEAIGSVSLAGEGTVANGSPASVNGTLGASPAGTFGIE